MKLQTGTIQLVIDEGIQTRVDWVQFEGLSVLSREIALELISLKPGQPFRDYMIENDETSLRQKLSELGYPKNRVIAKCSQVLQRSGI